MLSVTLPCLHGGGCLVSARPATQFRSSLLKKRKEKDRLMTAFWKVVKEQHLDRGRDLVLWFLPEQTMGDLSGIGPIWLHPRVTIQKLFRYD